MADKTYLAIDLKNFYAFIALPKERKYNKSIIHSYKKSLESLLDLTK